MQGIVTRTKKEETERKPLTPVESYYLRVLASKRMSKYLDRSLDRSYEAILKALKDQVYDRGENK